MSADTQLENHRAIILSSSIAYLLTAARHPVALKFITILS